jgi:cytochrome oxidase assembly protein ShyY1
MPFKSEKQRKWMWKNEPEMAKRWEEEEKRRAPFKQKKEKSTEKKEK